MHGKITFNLPYFGTNFHSAKIDKESRVVARKIYVIKAHSTKSYKRIKIKTNFITRNENTFSFIGENFDAFVA